MNENFNPDANINPSSGLMVNNPSHKEEAQYASNQSELVKAISGAGSGVKRERTVYNYTNMDPENMPPMAGITKIRSMSEAQVINFCKSLMRTRPNIFRLHIKLGNYPHQQEMQNSKTNLLNSNEPRFHTEVGEKIGMVLADKTMHVTEIEYVVNNADPGLFSAIARVYGVPEEEYNDDKLFAPTIGFEFIKTT